MEEAEQVLRGFRPWLTIVPNAHDPRKQGRLRVDVDRCKNRRRITLVSRGGTGSASSRKKAAGRYVGPPKSADPSLESSHPHRFDDEKQSVLDEMGNPYETKEEQDRLLAEAKVTHTVLAADPEERQQQRTREAEESERMAHEEHLSREHNKWHSREVLTQVSIQRARAEAGASAPALLEMGTTMRGIRERAQDEVNATILRMQTAREAWENGEATGGRVKGGVT